MFLFFCLAFVLLLKNPCLRSKSVSANKRRRCKAQKTLPNPERNLREVILSTHTHVCVCVCISLNGKLYSGGGKGASMFKWKVKVARQKLLVGVAT